MTFADAGTLDAVPGRRDEPVRHLTRRSDRLAELGCLLHEVGTNDAEPDRVFLIELWRDAAAHRASLAEPDVQASIAAARPLLAGTFGGFRFDVVGPPLRDWPPPPGTPRPLRAAGACGTEREEGGSGGVRAGIEVLEQGRPGRRPVEQPAGVGARCRHVHPPEAAAFRTWVAAGEERPMPEIERAVLERLPAILPMPLGT